MVITKPKPRHLFLKRTLAAVGTVVIILLVLHLWYVRNARIVLQQYITEESGGKIKLELSQLDINLFSKRLEINEASLTSTDSLNVPITYKVTFNKLSLRVNSVWALLFEKKLLLDSIKLYDPVIQVMQWKKDTAQAIVKDELSIPQEMGKFYNSMLNALNEFSIKRIIIENAKISLINKMKPASDPVTVSNIFFDLSRSAGTNGNKNIENYQTVELRTSYQNIALPDGRHHLSFKSLKLQLFRQRITLDSFTVTAKATDSLKSNYKIFFKKLSLTGVDFTAMSIQNLIKADTVFSEDPSFHINLYRSDAVNQKTQIPDADKILRELTANLNLAFIGVRNAGIHFDIYGETKRSFFNSNKDNFEIRGFRINPDSLHPVSIRRFDMTFKDYSYDNEDSSTIYSFGSLEFLNRRILLNNFSVISRSTQNKLRNEVAVKVPYFELADLDWYQLIFDQKIVAKAAILNNPVIDFSLKKTRGTGRKFNLFAGLQSLDSLVSLANVTVVNGDVNMQLGTGSSLKVQDIDFNIHSNKLLRSTNKEGLRRAVEQLSFSKGVLKFKDITAELHKARFTGDNLIYADKVAISGKGNKISALIGNVYIDNIQIDDYAEEIEVDRLSWQNASVQLKSIPIGVNDNTENTSRIHLKNVEGNNTQVNFSNGSILVSTYVRTLNAASILKERNDLIQVGGFNITGENLTVNTKAVKINAQSYDVAGTDASSITGLMVSQIKGRDSLKILSSKLNFSTNLNDLFASNLHFSNVDAKELIIEVKKWDTASVSTDTTSRQSSIRIDKLTASEPVIKISTFRNDSVSTIDIPWSEKSMANASDILLSEEGLHIGSLLVNTTSATLVKPTGEIRGVQKGRIEMDLSNIKYIKKDNKPKWSGTINHLFLENEKGLRLGTKGKLLFKKASLGNVSLSSDYMPDFDQLMKANVSAWLSIPEGRYADSLKTIKWYNANYTNSSRTLMLDSFVYHPTQPLDSVLAHAPYQLDYITVKTGAVSITDFDVAKFQTDSSIIVNAIRIENPVLVVYRDKKPPISPHKKALPLPVTLIKNISLPVSVQSVRIENGTIVYSEKNAKSRKQGNLLFTNVSGTVENIINNNFTNEDSLSLTLQGRLMDSADITLNLSESYADSLAAFLLNAKIKSADLSILNPVLIPISNVKITSGILDSVVIHAVGRQDFALGEMNMYYRDFRILFVKDGNPNKSTVLQHMWSFMVNTFVIKHKNRKRTGIIYYKRSDEQSFVNYIVKMTLSGVETSIGIKKNRKYMKQYKRELEKN